MAVSISTLTSGYDTNGNSTASTASVSPSANKLLLLTVLSRTGITANPNQPTVTGNGLTWVAVDSLLWDTSSSSRKKTTVFRAMGSSPSTGAISIDFGGQNQTHVSWGLEEFTGMDTSGTNGSGAIVQTAKGYDDTTNESSFTVTLGAFSSSSNATFGAWGSADDTQTATAGTGFTKYSDVTISGAGDPRLTTEFRNDNDTTVTISWSGTVLEKGGIGVEIRGEGQVYKDTSVNSGEVTSVSTKTQALTVGNLTNGGVFIRTATRGGSLTAQTISTVVFNGLSCSLIKANDYSDADAGRLRTEIWGVAVGTLASGSYNAVVTWGGTITRGVVEVSSWFNVDQTNITENTGGGSAIGQASPITNSATTVTANAYLIDTVYSKTGGALTVGTNQTQDANVPVNGGGDQIAMSREGAVVTPASTAMSWTYATGDDYCQSIAVIKPYSASVATTRRYSLTTLSVG